jgi:hypothetical protein
MLVSARHAIFALALLTGCVGVVGETTTDYQSPSNDAPRSGRDAGWDAGRDASGSGRAIVPDTSDGVDDGDAPDLSVLSQGSDASMAASRSMLGGCAKTQQEPLAVGLHIREIALYQTVKVSLVSDGTWVAERSAPVVQGKKSLVRVFVDPMAGYKAHNVRGVLTLDNDGTATELVDLLRRSASRSHPSCSPRPPSSASRCRSSRVRTASAQRPTLAFRRPVSRRSRPPRSTSSRW